MKKNIYLMYIMALLQGMVFYGPIATLYRQMAGVTIFQITIMESISLALCVVLEEPWGIVADKIGYRKTMIFCSVLYLISKVVFWRANGFLGFLMERIMLSVIIAGLSGVETSVLYLSSEKEEAQSVMGIYDNLLTVGLLIAAGVYSLMIKENYRLAGLLTVISYGIAAIVSFFLTEVTSPEEQKAPSAKEFAEILQLILMNKYMIFLLIGIALFNETHQTITVFLNQLKYIQCGWTDWQIGIIYILVTVVGLFGGLSSRLTKKVGVGHCGNLLFMSAIVSCLLLAVTTSKVLAVAAIGLLRISSSLFQPLHNNLQNRQIQTGNRATELSVNAVIMDGIAIATNVIFGKLAEMNLSVSMSAGALFCFAGLILFSLWYKNVWKKMYC